MTTLVKFPNNQLLHSFVDDFFNRDEHLSNVYLNRRIFTNIIETDKTYLLEIQAPGFSKEDFNIQLENSYLKVSANKHQENKPKEGEKFILREFRNSKFEKSYKVPTQADTEKISAQYENGVLKIEISKKETESNNQPKTINII